MEKRAFKDAVYGQLARIGKALASPKRLELLDLLCQRAWTVEDLADEASLSIANASRHLQILRAAHLVETQRRGPFVEYSVASEQVCTAAMSIRGLAETQLAELERITSRFAGGREEFVSIDRETLVRRLNAGTAILLDVRPETEFRSAHLPGAVSIPVESLEDRLRELPRKRKIVAYCRGPYCLYASDAVRLLRERGYDAVRYDEGVSEWRARGLAIESPTNGNGHSAPSATVASVASRAAATKEPPMATKEASTVTRQAAPARKASPPATRALPANRRASAATKASTATMKAPSARKRTTATKQSPQTAMKAAPAAKEARQAKKRTTSRSAPRITAGSPVASGGSTRQSSRGSRNR